MSSLIKSTVYTIAITLAMVFFVDMRLVAQDVGVERCEQDTITQRSRLLFNTFIDSNSRFSYRRLYGLFVRKGNQKGEIIQEHKSIERFEEFNNKEIADIQYVRLKAFGQSVYDLNKMPEEWLEKLGNAFHTTTARKVIEHNILFRPNDLLNPIDLVETEQILRSRKYIEDVNILVEPMPNSDKVCVFIITKDKFTKSAHLDFRNFDKWETGISESSLGGIGVSLFADLYHNEARSSAYGYKFELAVDNIWGSFISADMYYRNGVGYNTKYINFNRDFYASKVRLAGGLTYKSTEELYGVYIIDTTISVNYTLKDAWVGHSFRLSRKSSIKAPVLFTIAAKYRQINYNKGLPTTVNMNPYFNSTKHYLMSFGVSWQNLYQSNLIYQFGSTEDIPVGFRLMLATGFEEDQFQRRYLVNGEIAGANYFRFGYLFGSVRFGGYATDEKQLEQASLNIRTTYISNLLNLGKHKMRQFISLNYTKGLSRFQGEREYIVLGNSYGIRGLKSCELVGTTRMVVNLESMIYSPYKIYGFSLAYFPFCDMGLIGFGDDYYDSLYSGFGFGIRLRNESTVFPTVLLRLAYYPVIPPGATVSNYYITSEGRRRFEQFRAQEPQLLPFE